MTKEDGRSGIRLLLTLGYEKKYSFHFVLFLSCSLGSLADVVNSTTEKPCAKELKPLDNLSVLRSRFSSLVKPQITVASIDTLTAAS